MVLKSEKDLGAEETHYANVLKNFLINEGHEVTTNLFDDDIDIVLITDPRKVQKLLLLIKVK